MKKWIPAIGSFFASVIIGDYLGMSFWQWMPLWVSMDLMTANRRFGL